MPFGVVPRPVIIPTKQSSFGIHPDISRVELAAMPRIGIKWLRIFENWHRIEKNPGQYTLNTNLLDQAVAFNLSVIYSLKIIESLPKGPWTEQQLSKHEQSLTSMISWLVKNAPSSIKVWKIENEPDLIYPTHLQSTLKQSAKAYGKILGFAGKAFHQANPKTTVAGMSVSGNELNNSFIKQANAISGNVYKIASIHPYNGSRFISPLTRAVAPDAYIRQRLLDKAAIFEGKRLWAGEIGCAYDTREPLDSKTYRTYSDYVARALILMKSVPQLKKIIWFKSQGCYERNHFQYGLWRSEFEPLPATVFYANVAQQLEYANPYKPVYESDLQVYTFTDRNNKPFAAAWRYKGDIDQMLIDLPINKVHVTDLFGNPVKLSQKQGKTVIPINSTPVWIRIDKLDANTLVEKLSTTEINLPPVTLTTFLADQKQVVVFVKNNLQKPIQVNLQLTKGSSRSFKMQQGQTYSVTLQPSKITNKLQLTASTPFGNVEQAIDQKNILPCHEIKAENFTTIFNSKTTIQLNQRESIYPPDPNIGWETSADLNARFTCGYDAKYFYFAADVTDPIHFQTSESYRAWHGDSIQLAFDTLNDAREGIFKYDNNDCEFIAWLSPSGGKLATTHDSQGNSGSLIKNAEVDISRQGNITRYRLSIPWDQMEKLNPMSGRLFGMNFIVNQNNEKGRRYWLGLTEGIGEVKYPYLYRRFRLNSAQQLKTTRTN